jgi:hypothetical protein
MGRWRVQESGVQIEGTSSTVFVEYGFVGKRLGAPSANWRTAVALHRAACLKVCNGKRTDRTLSWNEIPGDVPEVRVDRVQPNFEILDLPLKACLRLLEPGLGQYFQVAIIMFIGQITCSFLHIERSVLATRTLCHATICNEYGCRAPNLGLDRMVEAFIAVMMLPTDTTEWQFQWLIICDNITVAEVTSRSRSTRQSSGSC